MKASIDAIIQRRQAEYLDRLLPRSSGVLAEMEEDAARNRVPIADREVALFLEITARAMGARRVLEIGMAIGYSVVYLAQATGPDGLVVTIEPDDEMIRRACPHREGTSPRDHSQAYRDLRSGISRCRQGGVFRLPQSRVASAA
jgi:predicted O-methyltransferase YrrM